MKPLNHHTITSGVVVCANIALVIALTACWKREQSIRRHPPITIPVDNDERKLRLGILRANEGDLVILPKGSWKFGAPLKVNKGATLIGVETNTALYFTNPAVFYKEFK